jgi:hypothetical protein
MAVVREQTRAPLSVSTVFEALTDARPDVAAGAFSDDALLAYWEDGEATAARSIARGSQAIRAALARAREARPELLACVHQGSNCFVEGRVAAAGGEVTATFAASMQLNADGAIARCLALHCPEVEPHADSRAGIQPMPGAARAVLDRYLRHLCAGEFVEATSCFSEDCLYSHPPYWPGTPWAKFRGREALLAGFERRGIRPARPTIVCCVQRGSGVFIEGVVDGIGNGGSFISSVWLDNDGLIQRYVAFYTVSRIARRDQSARTAGGAHRA